MKSIVVQRWSNDFLDLGVLLYRLVKHATSSITSSDSGQMLAHQYYKTAIINLTNTILTQTLVDKIKFKLISFHTNNFSTDFKKVERFHFLRSFYICMYTDWILCNLRIDLRNYSWIIQCMYVNFQVFESAFETDVQMRFLGGCVCLPNHA